MNGGLAPSVVGYNEMLIKGVYNGILEDTNTSHTSFTQSSSNIT